MTMYDCNSSTCTKWVFSIIILGLALYMFSMEWFGYKKRQEHLKKEEQESKLRMQNPEYVALLKELGYQISDEKQD